ncbi:adenylate/guanylate cyclase domain-containing protein [Coleofasciculus sp. E1-EBD-02]|uniref:adenylate/guanylate cyclase domain-containing protein n=1 Tax=Coleofasciculus sp. E1-EBD-02 TaxID=3068481 RepID=UPI0032FA394D
MGSVSCARLINGSAWLMIKTDTPLLSKIHRYIPVGLTLAVGIGLSIAATVTAGKWANNQTRLQLQQQTDNLTTTFQRKIDEYYYMVVSLSAFHEASDQVQQDDYEAFTQHFLSIHSGILTLGWLKPVSARERPSYEAQMAEMGFANFSIYEYHPVKKQVIAKARSDYFPITFSPQQDVIGFDLASHPVGKSLLEKARMTGQLVATSKLKIPGKPPDSLTILLPLYHNDMPHNTPETRRQAFRGAMIGVYSLEEIITTSLKGLQIDTLNFCLSDPSLPSPERYLALYQSQTETVEMKPDRSSCRNHYIYTHPIQVADQQLSLSFWEIPQNSGWGIPPLAGVTLLSGLLLTGTLVLYIVRSLHYTAEIEAEREKSELLLLNILPKPIADRLKQNQQTIADSFTEATVLFADIVGFTQLSQRISATELVKLLNEIFSAFDQLTETYGLEKIKTIGDAYMVVGGLPTPCDNHADAIADMALEMQQQVAQFSAKYGEPFKIRIGINTGPVVAGVIGTKKFIYDLWGDAVNTASRMESHGVPGGIQVSASTYQHLRDKYQFEERGTIQVKGKGEMMTYLLKNRKKEKTIATD